MTINELITLLRKVEDPDIEVRIGPNEYPIDDVVLKHDLKDDEKVVVIS